jgi:glycosyltransferase involved in cell wall biosynthesis
MNHYSIWHHAVGPTPDSVSGVDQTVWALGAEQARRGHRVTFLTRGSPEQVTKAQALGVRLLPIKAALRGVPPDLLHMHSVFIPAQAKLAVWAVRNSIPYIITPHGGVAPGELSHGRLKKATYSALVERPRFRWAAGTTAILEAERPEIRAFIGSGRPTTFAIPNAMKSAPAEVPLVTCEDVVFLGRFDWFRKGIDRLADFAEEMPGVSFGFYGRQAASVLPALPRNVTLHDPVYGQEKWSVLRSAAVYMQLSRWEAFGLSVFEAMMVGTPPIVSREMHVAPLVAAWGGLVVDANQSVVDWVASVEKLIDGRADRAPLLDMARAASSMTQVERVADQFDAAYGAALNSEISRQGWMRGCPGSRGF